MKRKIDVLDKGFVKLVRHMGSDTDIVKNARVSYKKGTKSVSDDTTLLRYLMRHKHTTPFECVVFTFHVKLPLFVTAQWHRHRTWSFNQVSGRYSELPNECYVPSDENFTKQDPNNKQGGTNEPITIADLDPKAIEDWTDVDYVPYFDGAGWSWEGEFESMQNHIHEQYEAFLRTGVRRELARINLPVSQYTEMMATVNLHNLFHFLKLRLDSHAQYEIRVYAEAIYDLIKQIVPESCRAFEDYVLNSITFSSPELKNLKKLLGDVKRTDGLGSREKKEFIDKINKILDSN